MNYSEKSTVRSLLDPYGRKIDYLRISVTDRCNLRCIYCMPQYEVTPRHHNEILTFEEIEKVATAAVTAGINKIRITGGEPLVRKGIVNLIAALSRIKGIVDLSMTTNGIYLSQHAASLKKAGLRRINISMDTLNKHKYKTITRIGKLREVLRSIEEAEKTGFLLKINVVVIRGINEDEILDFVAFSRAKNLCVRFIEFMPTNSYLFWEPKKFISMDEVKRHCEESVALRPVESEGSGPAEYYEVIGSARGTIGFIRPFSHPFCSRCNRLRLTSDGKLRGCLHSEYEVDLKKALRQDASPYRIGALIKKSILHKPKEHSMTLRTTNYSPSQSMSQIGG